jgi:hypothetical protein
MGYPMIARLGISIGGSPLASPDPGCLAAVLPSLNSTDRLMLAGYHPPLFLASAVEAELPGLEATRLALQLFLVKGFKLYSFQLQDSKEPCISIYCHYLPVSGLGNLRACCLPWMW